MFPWLVLPVGVKCCMLYVLYMYRIHKYSSSWCHSPQCTVFTVCTHTSIRQKFSKHRQQHNAHQPTTGTDKMASSELTAALEFLTDAGHLLATTAPEASAYLMSRRTDLMFEHELPQPDKQRQHVCSGCGHIMFLGRGSILQVRPEKKASKGKGAQNLRLQPRLSGPTKAITCGHCAKLTEIKLPAPVRISRRNTRMQKPLKTPAPGVTPSLSNAPQETSSQKSSASASSKKRAKSRKAGLQALLDQSSAARSSRPGLGLSLADFVERK